MRMIEARHRPMFTRCAIPEVVLVEPLRHADARGCFCETFRANWFEELGLDRAFVQDNHSLSVARGVVRGLHVQIGSAAQDRLLRCVRGAVMSVAVDLRAGAPSYGAHVTAGLTADNGRQILVPMGFAHGFVTLEPMSEVVYKTTAYFSPDHHRGLAWDDPALAIDWRLGDAEPVLSERDRAQPRLADLPVWFHYRAPGYQVGLGDAG